jgi:uncharacterized protein
MHHFITAIAGGALLGVAGILLLLFNGRILGVSGILGGAIDHPRAEGWRWAFVSGLLLAGGTFMAFDPRAFDIGISRSVWACLAGGFFVGLGTRLGGGCTSGHGICGISRFSKRSIVATCVFMFAGGVAVYVIRTYFGGSM